MNVAFTKHITNALMIIREEKLKQKVSIPKKLEDGWEPIIDMNMNDFDCHALYDLGASISIMPRKIYDMLGLPPLENCYFDVPLADVAKKKPLGRINDILIMVNNNLVPVDFLVMDVECKAPLNINSYSRKLWNTSLERGRNYFLTLFLEQIMNLMLHRLILLDFYFLRLAQRR
jgi:hypothetical protein